MKRPFGFLAALRYGVRAGIAHYRFARQAPWRDGIRSLLSSTQPSHDRMDDAGCRWSDWSRICGAQPVDPERIWDDVSTLWSAYHSASRPVAPSPAPGAEK